MRELFAYPQYWRWLVAAQLQRLPAFMASMAFVLVGMRVEGDAGAGGLMVTAYVLCLTVFAPIVGRVVDRAGLARGAPVLLALAGAALLSIAGLAVLGTEVWVLLLLAGAAGALASGTPGTVRTLLSELLPDRLLASALALDATVVELAVVAAPLLAAAASSRSPFGAVGLMAAASFGAALLLRRLSRAASARGRPDVYARPSSASSPLLANRRFVFWLLASAAFGHALGTAETGALPLAARLGGGTGAAAALVAVLSGSSGLAGLAYAGLARQIALKPVHLARLLLAGMCGGSMLLSMSAGWVGAGAAMAMIGFCAAPLSAVRGYAAEADIPPLRKAEAFSWIGAAQSLGFAMAGLLLAILPLKWMLAAGGITAAAAIVAASTLAGQPVTAAEDNHISPTG